MKEEREKLTAQKNHAHPAKECAYIAVFVALVIAAQLALSALPGVEIVTVLFIAYAYAFGWKRGMFSATVFTLLRQIVFGFFPSVLILYLVYYNLLALVFGWLGKKYKKPTQKTWVVLIVACVCTAGFTLLDCIISSLFYGFTVSATKAYLMASLPVCGIQTVCTGVTVGVLFIPLTNTFLRVVKM